MSIFGVFERAAPVVVTNLNGEADNIVNICIGHVTPMKLQHAAHQLSQFGDTESVAMGKITPGSGNGTYACVAGIVVAAKRIGDTM